MRSGLSEDEQPLGVLCVPVRGERLRQNPGLSFGALLLGVNVRLGHEVRDVLGMCRIWAVTGTREEFCVLPLLSVICSGILCGR